MGRKNLSRTLQDRIYADLASSRRHRSFHLPATATHPLTLRVTYSDVGADADTNIATVLFCGGLMGGRWTTHAMHALAQQHGVRILCTDRPGMGGSDPVPLSQRLAVWLETVPALLHHLHIPLGSISLASHSGGTIYALTTLLHQRHLLDPRSPYVAMFAPWVHQSRSGVLLMGATAYLPTSWIEQLHRVTGFVNARVTPVVGFSGGLVGSLTSSSASSGGLPGDGEGEEADEKAFRSALVLNYVFAEDVSGSSDEALLLLRRTLDPATAWGAWGDYDAYVPLLVESLRGGVEERGVEEVGERSQRVHEQPKLLVDIFYPSSDALVGAQGMAWFSKCWDVKGAQDLLEVRTVVCERGTGHDGVLETRYAALGQWLGRVAKKMGT